MVRWSWTAVILCGAAFFGACGDDGPRGIGRDTTQVADTTGDSAGEVGADGSSTDTVAPAPRACSSARACTTGTCRSGVCVVDPPTGLEGHVTDPGDNAVTEQWPELGCVDQSPPAVTESGTATLYGAVVRFGSGRKTTKIHVDVLSADGFDPSACEAKPLGDRKACYRAYGTPVGSALSASATVSPSELPSECRRHEACPLGYQCFDPNKLGGTCQEQFGLYEIQNVPLDTPLIIRSYATESENQWHDTWVFNVVLHSEDVVDGRVQYDAQMVSEGQWILTSNTVSLPEIAEDHGAIGGRVRDCGDGSRVAWPIANVRLGLERPGRAFVYFNDLEDDTVPLVDRESTDIIGRFAALDVPAGWNRIAGAARVNGTVVSVGSAPVYVAPGMLSIVSWPGTRPFWRQE